VQVPKPRVTLRLPQVLVDKRDIAMEEENIQRFTTLMYRAPEMADVHSRMLIGPPGAHHCSRPAQQLNFCSADMWALGCLLYTLCYGTHPFASATQLQIVNANVRYPQAAPGGQPVNPVALAILQALLQQQVPVYLAFSPPPPSPPAPSSRAVCLLPHPHPVLFFMLLHACF
jgi:serine/threonine protein kinase